MSELHTASGAERWGRESFALFAEDFDVSPAAKRVPEPELIPPGFSAADIAAARAEAWAEGHAAGVAEAAGTSAAQTRRMLESLATILRETRDQAAATAERTAEQIARLVLDSVAGVLPAMCARHGEAELRALVGRLLPALARELSVAVRLNPAHIPALMRELDQLGPDLAERVQLIPVEAIPPGDLRASWQDGVAVRDTRELCGQIRAVLETSGLLTPAPAPAQSTELLHVG